MADPTREKALVLVADHRDSSRVALARALREAGLEVQTARDGSRALEISVLEGPDLIVFETTNPLIDGRRFVDILHSNPRTENTPAIVTGEDPNELGESMGLRVSFVRWPYDVEDVVRLIQDVLGRTHAAEEVSQSETKTEGNLEQIGLTDLLQIFAMNRKEGRLVMTLDPQQGEIFLRDGGVVHAHLGPTSGIKALYRMLAWESGRFEYVPGRIETATTIKGTPEEIIMEGTRQADEIERMGAARPARDAHIRLLIDRGEIPQGLHQVTEEVIELLEFYDTVGEVLDQSTHTDFEVYRAVRLLEEKEIIELGQPPEDTGPGEDVVPSELLARLFSRSRVGGGAMAPEWKVVVLARNRRALKRFLSPFGRVSGFEVDTPFFASSGGEVPPIGTAARLKLGDRHTLLFVACPSDEIFRPMLGLFVDRALAVIVVDWTGAEALAALVREALPVETLPVDLASFAPEGATPDAEGARSLLHRLVLTALA